jgi:hypothetical protein
VWMWRKLCSVEVHSYGFLGYLLEYCVVVIGDNKLGGADFEKNSAPFFVYESRS